MGNIKAITFWFLGSSTMTAILIGCFLKIEILVVLGIFFTLVSLGSLASQVVQGWGK